MATIESVSNDGSWKITVEAWSFSLVVYSAMGVTTRVFDRGTTSWWDRLWGVPAGWVPGSADAVTASGSLSARTFSPASMNIPGSPATSRNARSADCRAWAIGAGISVDVQDGGVQPARGPISHLADFVQGSGSAARGAETLSAAGVTFPP